MLGVWELKVLRSKPDAIPYTLIKTTLAGKSRLSRSLSTDWLDDHEHRIKPQLALCVLAYRPP
jgi:hypothetical protein